jgi:alpha-tubulin suppressor-like RCC1 family protein
MKKITFLTLSLGLTILGTTLLNTSPVVTNAEVTHGKDYIPQYNQFFFVDVAVAGTSNLSTFATLTDTGRVFTHGYGVDGRIGNGALLSSNIPVEITASFTGLASGDQIINIEGGGNYFIALSQTGKVYGWGDNGYGQLGSTTPTPSNTPVSITGFESLLSANEKLIDIKAGLDSVIAQTSSNRFVSWGNNANGVLGRTTNTAFGFVESGNNTSFEIPGGEVFVEYGLYSNTPFILTNKSLYTWGLANTNQTGLGNTTTQTRPVKVTSISTALGSETFVSASIGTSHGFAVSNTGKIWGWGAVNQNQLTKYEGSIVNAPKLLTSYFTDDLVHYPNADSYSYSIVGSNEKITGVMAFDDTSFAEVSYRYINNGITTFEPDYVLAWGKNGTSDNVNNIGRYLGLLGNGYEGSKVGVPDGVSSYLGVDDDLEDYSLFVVNRGSSTALKSKEGIISFIGNNTYGQLGNGLSGLNTSTDLSGDINVTPHTFDKWGDEGSSGYYYVSSVEYRSRNLQVNFVNRLPNPFNAATINTNNYYYDLAQQIIVYYYGWATWGSGFFTNLNLVETSLDIFDASAIAKIEAVFFDYDVQYYISNYLLDLEYLSSRDSDDRYFDRQWAEDVARYYTEFDDYRPISAAAIALLETATIEFVSQLQLVLSNVAAFETKLMAFRDTVDIYDEDEFNVNTFMTYVAAIEDIFAHYETLSELEKLYFDVYNDFNYDFDYLYGYYEDLYYYYIDVIIENYLIDLNNIYDLEYSSRYNEGLFENIDLIKSVLAKINLMPLAARDAFKNYNEYYDEYDYYDYYYWLYLNDLVPFLEEGLDVFNQLSSIYNSVRFEYYDDEYDDYDYYFEVEIEDADAIIKMYKDYLALSSGAQDLFNFWDMEYLYYTALELLANRAETKLFNLMEAQYDDENRSTYVLFANYNDVLTALATYEALPEDAIDYLDEDAIEYYEYLLSIKLALEEGLTVYGLIVNIEDNIIKYDTDGDPYIELKDVSAVLNMYAEYLKLSDDAKELLDPEYVAMIYTLALQAQANVVIGQLNDLAVVEEDTGTYALFENYTDVMAALDAYNALSADAKNLLDPETQAYYAYLNGLKTDLQAGLGVFNQIVTIEDLDLDNPSPATLTAISNMINDFNSLTPAQQALLAPYVNDLRAIALGRVSGLINVLPADVESFEAAFNDPETKDAAVTNLLAAWEHYNALSDELKAQLDPLEVARLQALHARYLELLRPAMDLLMLGLIIVHLLSFTYFAFKKRDVLSPIVKA